MKYMRGLAMSVVSQPFLVEDSERDSMACAKPSLFHQNMGCRASRFPLASLDIQL